MKTSTIVNVGYGHNGNFQHEELANGTKFKQRSLNCAKVRVKSSLLSGLSIYFMVLV